MKTQRLGRELLRIPTFGGFRERALQRSIPTSARSRRGCSSLFIVILSSYDRRRVNWTGLSTILILCTSLRLFAATRIELDRDWMFRIDPNSTGELARWQDHAPTDAVFVNLPHTWNLGRQDGYLGKAWYYKKFDIPLSSPNLHVRLHFGATFYSSHVWLNGVSLGTHEGGYTAYSFDITHQLQASNYVAVEIDNRI